MRALPGAEVVPVGLPRRPGALAPDAVSGPQAWPDPEAGAECDDCQDISWCDTSWARRYAELHAAHDALLGHLRRAADDLAADEYRTHPAIGEAARHLRALVRDAQVRRTPLPSPRSE